MKIIIVKLSLLSLVAFLVLTQQVPADPVTLGVFVASSPCDGVSRLLLGIPAGANCDLIKWQLTLYQDPHTLAPSSYQLSYTYGLPQQGTLELAQGGTRSKREGRWAIIGDAETVPGATVYRLDPDSPQESVSFLKVDHNLIHLLDRDGKLVVGSAGWSYTLNRAGGSGEPTQRVSPLSISAAEPDFRGASTLPVTTAASVVETFVGRSPCREVAAQLNKAVNADCKKAKWELTLHQDTDALTPTTYRLRGTFYRKRIREGRWAIVRGTKTDPAAVIYQLDPNDGQGSLLFLKADDNILLFLDRERNLMVGNADFSYTLNREESVFKK